MLSARGVGSSVMRAITSATAADEVPEPRPELPNQHDACFGVVAGIALAEVVEQGTQQEQVGAVDHADEL